MTLFSLTVMIWFPISGFVLYCYHVCILSLLLLPSLVWFLGFPSVVASGLLPLPDFGTHALPASGLYIGF